MIQKKRVVSFKDIFHPSIMKAFKPYPRWEAWQIKRKYKDSPAIYIEKWIPYRKLFDLIPKVKPSVFEWRIKKC